jgi:phage gpG-like protein
MPRHLKSRITSGQTKVGFEGLKGALARWHNKGTKGQDGLKRPKRDFLGIGAADRREIESLINQHFS